MAVKLPISAAFFPKNIKIWGDTQTILLNESSHVAFAKLNKGGYSSRHSHNVSWNRFFIISGTLRITVYRNNQEENILLNSGECLDIEPGLEHRMAALEYTEIIEMYWTDDNSVVDPKDIIRKDTGGFYGKEEEEQSRG